MPDITDTQDAWDAYCKQDVQVLRVAMEAWFMMLDDNNLGNYQLTAASQAFSAYRHRFMEHDITIDTNILALQLSRRAYFGGRVEAFRLGHFKGEFYMLDVNSLYPFCMATYALPYKLIGYYQTVLPGTLEGLLERYAVTARVRIQTSKPRYPVVYNKRLCFPVGEFDAYLNTPEIKGALVEGDIKAVGPVALYEKAVL
jgi:hypothetical protein